MIKKVKNNVPSTYVVSRLTGEKLLELFTKKNLKKKNKKSLESKM